MVVAAAGIADGRGLAAALALGVEGVLVGTRFYATVESLGHDKAKTRILAASGEDTLRTSVFDTVRGYHWPDGTPRNSAPENWRTPCLGSQDASKPGRITPRHSRLSKARTEISATCFIRGI